MRKKMYKAKKHWVIASAATLTVFGAAATGLTVSADETRSQSSTEAVTTQDPESSATERATSSEASSTGSSTMEMTSIEETTQTEATDDWTEAMSETEEDSSETAEAESEAIADSVETRTEDTADTAEAATDSAETTKSSTEILNSSTESSSVDYSAETASTTTSSVSETLTTVAQAATAGNSDDTTTALVEASVSGTTLTITYNGTASSDETIKFAVWSEKNDQDDLVWYDADAAGMAYIDLSNHKSYGTYYIHTYSVTSSQTTGLNAMSITVAQPEVTTAVAKTSSSNYQITISNVPDTITSITVPVWSEKNGQDDLVWYTASQVSEGTYTVNVSVTDHSSDTGHYNVHVYGHSSITGGLIGLAATSGFDNIDDRANATVSVVNYAESKSTFDVIVAGSSSTKDISSVAIAVWSEDKGQDDLKWYTPTVSNNTATATINIADLSNTTDNYIVHVYTTYSDGTTVGTDLGTYRITTKHEVTAALTSTGISLSLDSNTVSDYSKVKFAVWSSENGQDDLVWYDASPTGTALAAYTNHSGYGTYYIHTYSYESGRAIGLNATTITIAAPSVTTAVTRTSDTTYTITVSNVPLYIDSVLVPTWTDTNGQDDIVWTATTQSDSTTYTATISLRDHSYELGTYVAHVYGRSQLSNNQLVGLGITNFTVDSIDTAIENPTITVTSYDADAGTLTLKISETNNSKKISSANVAAWSESDQSNLYWYTETATDGTVIVTINAKNHNYSQGDYTVHAYVTFIDSTTTGYVVGTYTFNAEKPISSTGYFVDISSHNGAISVAEFTALKNQGITGVVVKLTEGTSYTNPYAASQIANAQAAGLKVSAYHYSHYTTTGEAVAEAQYFVSVARSLGLSTSAVMVNDMEESTMLSADINANTQAWKNEMNRLGYTNLVYYTMASWLDIRGGRVSTSQFGFENFWIAHYVNGYTYLSQESALSLSYYSSAAAWQYTSVSTKLSSSYLDENIDYTGRFTS